MRSGRSQQSWQPQARRFVKFLEQTKHTTSVHFLLKPNYQKKNLFHSYLIFFFAFVIFASNFCELLVSLHKRYQKSKKLRLLVELLDGVSIDKNGMPISISYPKFSIFSRASGGDSGVGTHYRWR